METELLKAANEEILRLKKKLEHLVWQHHGVIRENTNLKHEVEWESNHVNDLQKKYRKLEKKIERIEAENKELKKMKTGPKVEDKAHFRSFVNYGILSDQAAFREAASKADSSREDEK
jgi:predicted nuclease with TOPRIM domain